MNVQVSARVDEKIRDRAEEVLAREGLDISTLLRIVLTKTANEQRVPVQFGETASFIKRRQDLQSKLNGAIKRAKDEGRILTHFPVDFEEDKVYDKYDYLLK